MIGIYNELFCWLSQEANVRYSMSNWNIDCALSDFTILGHHHYRLQRKARERRRRAVQPQDAQVPGEI
jgi:hypothetical protein